MTKPDINILIKRYNEGTATEEELSFIEKLIEQGQLDIEQLQDVSANLERVNYFSNLDVRHESDARFYDMLADEMKDTLQGPIFDIQRFWQWLFQPQMQWAYTLVVLLFGLAIGFFGLRSISGVESSEELLTDISDLRQNVMMVMLDQESSTDRLKGVSMSDELDEVNEAVASALINSLRNDPSVTVRVASVGALAKYTDKASIRQALIESIQFQDSPLVQLALAELMVAMQENSAVKEFNKIIDKDETPAEIKEELKTQMDKLVLL